MDINVYEEIKEGLKNYNNAAEGTFGNVIVDFPTVNPTYPYTVFDEIRNVGDRQYKTNYDKVSSLGYRVDVYAKTMGSYTKQYIARRLASMIDRFLTNIGLDQVTWNVENIENEGSIYHIVMTYTGSLHENRRKFI